jgi:hypothetical protein
MTPFDLAEACSDEVEICLPRLAAPHLKGMEDVDRLIESGDIADPVFQSGVDPDLLDTWPHRDERLPVVGHQAGLNPAQLVAGPPARIAGEDPEVLQRPTDPHEGLVAHRAIYM